MKQSLQTNQYRLHVAKGDLHNAQKRLESRLYSLYVNPRPSAVEVMAGANSLSQIIDREESAKVLSNQDTALGEQAVQFEHAVQTRERQLKSLEAKRAAAARAVFIHRLGEIRDALMRTSSTARPASTCSSPRWSALSLLSAEQIMWPTIRCYSAGSR